MCTENTFKSCCNARSTRSSRQNVIKCHPHCTQHEVTNIPKTEQEIVLRPVSCHYPLWSILTECYAIEHNALDDYYTNMLKYEQYCNKCDHQTVYWTISNSQHCQTWCHAMMSVRLSVCPSELGDRAFSAAGPLVWNSLPPSLRFTDAYTELHRQPQKNLFKQAFRS